jgi:hypothetical protein
MSRWGSWLAGGTAGAGWSAFGVSMYRLLVKNLPLGAPKDEYIGVDIKDEIGNGAINFFVYAGLVVVPIVYGAKVMEFHDRGRTWTNALTLGYFGSSEQGQRCGECTTLLPQYVSTP